MSTIRLLTLNPGRLFREFLSGKRKSYYKPVAFFVLLTAIYIIVRSGIGYDPFQNQSQMNGEGVHEKAKPFIEAGKFMVANINNIMFFLVFSIGFSHKLFFRKKYLLAEYVTIGFFIAGIYLIFGLLLMIYSVTISFVTPQYATIFLFIYLFYSAISFHQRLSFGSFIKYLLLSVLSIFLYILLGFGFSLFVVVFS
ncbi:DUF3667 domain-containing protein [Ekhidna sp.]|uniref:DUF3667 domain-containing protein n=1 Tax=Ekhidna sp. TaxID=2608089 RepID=UPI003B5043D2